MEDVIVTVLLYILFALILYLWIKVFKFSVFRVTPNCISLSSLKLSVLSLPPFMLFSWLYIFEWLMKNRNILYGFNFIILIGMITLIAGFYGKIIKTSHHTSIGMLKGLKILLILFLASVPFFFGVFILIFMVAGV